MIYSIFPVISFQYSIQSVIDPFNNGVIRGKSLKSMSLFFNEFSQITNIEPKLTNIGTKTGVNNLEMSSVSTISHEVRLLPQHLSVNDVIITRVYQSTGRLNVDIEMTSAENHFLVAVKNTCLLCIETNFTYGAC